MNAPTSRSNTPALAHDKRVCIFAAEEIVSSRNGGTFICDGFPDEIERNLKAIDLVGHDDIGIIVAEHTVIESYMQQLHDNTRIGEFFRGFGERFGHSHGSPGHFTLCLHPRGVGDIPKKRMRNALDQLESWVREQELPVPEIPPTTPNHVAALPPVVPFPVTLFRMKSAPEDDGSLSVAMLRNHDLESDRVARIDVAFREKVPKLEAARAPTATTLLVLECRDFIMANPVRIAQAVHSVGHGFAPTPDAIVCIDTAAGDGHWLGYRIKEGDWWSASARDLPNTS